MASYRHTTTPNYVRVNHSAINWKQTRYRLLQSTLATLIDLRNTTENPDLVMTYQNSIETVQREIASYHRPSH